MLDRDKYLSEKEARTLMTYAEGQALRALERGTKFFPKAWCIIDVLLSTGIRASECRKIKIADLYLGNEPCISVIGKGRKSRTIQISAGLKKHLKQYLQFKKRIKEGTEIEDYLFLNKFGGCYSLMGIQSLFKSMAKRAGLRSVYSIHSTRHCFGFLMYKKTRDIRLVQELLGHSDLSSTQIYTHIDLEAKVAAVNNLWTEN